MGFFSDLFKADRELEEAQLKRARELEMELMMRKLKMNESVNVQETMDKMYGLDKIQQKKEQKEQTKNIIKGAVVGGVVAGNAGAVVGAMVAQNKINNSAQHTNSSSRNITYTHITNDKTQQYHSNKIEDSNDDILRRYKSFVDDYNNKGKNIFADKGISIDDVKKMMIGTLADDCLTAMKILGVATTTDVVALLDVAGIIETNKNIHETLYDIYFAGGEVDLAEINKKKFWFVEENSVITKNTIVSKESNDTQIASNIFSDHEKYAYYNSFAGAPYISEYYDGEGIREKLTGDIEEDILIITAELGGCIVISQVAEILGITNQRASASARKLIEKGKYERFEFNKIAYWRLPELIDNDKSQSKEKDSFEEIKKYKELLDCGIITEEEFAMKKKELLGF